MSSDYISRDECERLLSVIEKKIQLGSFCIQSCIWKHTSVHLFYFTDKLSDYL